MPKSRVRNKKVYTAPAGGVAATASPNKRRPSPPWVPGTALALALVGMIWLVIYYLSSGTLPISGGPRLNIGIGFGCIIASLVVFTRWR
ncbi:MAG: cell division protein CrgA [Mycobacteriales bacterium]